MMTYKEKGNGTLLLDILTRTALGYEFKIEIVSALFVMVENNVFSLVLIRVGNDFRLEIYFPNLTIKNSRSPLIFKVLLKFVLSFCARKSRYESYY